KKKVKALNKIQPEKVMFSDKVKISAEDYDSLVTNSKRYIAHKSNEKALTAKVSALESENKDLKQEVAEKDNEISRLKSLRERLNIANLQREVAQLRKKLDRVMEFLDIFGLREKFEQFLKIDKKQKKDMER
ncbi:MAG: hypothetical protein MR413_00940, partial [Clostridia bacterium]|nr:hypothetical protein [Clostridia bacterium]